MPGLTIGWEYLTGCCVATDPASRQRAEWPPHPGRVFMAIAAAWFETGEDADEGQALRWVEKLGDPELGLPRQDSVFERSPVEVAVPPNDVLELWWKKEGKLSFGATKYDLAIGRKPTMRSFPSFWVGEAQCFLRWPHAADTEIETNRTALDRLCSKVTRIGHSSSLVRMWLADEIHSPQPTETWVPDDGLAVLQVRRVSEGTLDFLDRQFNRRGREGHQRLSDRIAELKAEKKATKG
jgi:CRISPR-associated protein Csb2